MSLNLTPRRLELLGQVRLGNVMQEFADGKPGKVWLGVGLEWRHEDITREMNRLANYWYVSEDGDESERNVGLSPAGWAALNKAKES